MSANFWEQYDEEYSAAETVSNDVIPDGEYEVTVSHCAEGQSKVKGTPQIQWGFTIATGPFTGRKLFKDQCITEKGIGFVRGDFEKVFPKGWKLSQCMAALGSLVGARLKVKSVTRKGDQYPTVYINKRLGEGSVQYAEPPAPAQSALPGVPVASTPFD